MYTYIQREREERKEKWTERRACRGEKDACGKTTIENYVSVARKEKERREKAEREKRI